MLINGFELKVLVFQYLLTLLLTQLDVNGIADIAILTCNGHLLHYQICSSEADQPSS